MRVIYVIVRRLLSAFVKIFRLNGDDQQARTEYRLVIIKDVDLSEVFSVVLSRERVYIIFSGIFVFGLLCAFLFFAYTPLKYLLPHYNHFEERRELSNLKRTVDSLNEQFRYNEQFIRQFQSYFKRVEDDGSQVMKLEKGQKVQKVPNSRRR